MDNLFNETLLTKLADKYNIKKKFINKKIKVPIINNINILDVKIININNTSYYIDNDHNVFDYFCDVNKNILIGRKIGYVENKIININKIDLNT